MITDKSVHCACGGRFTTLDDLDDHISLSFMPDDDIGSDGTIHYEIYSDAQRRSIPQGSDERWMGPQNWAAVARAINDRIRELGWRQRELAERSHVSLAVVREIQRHTVERHRHPRTLEALSVALG